MKLCNARPYAFLSFGLLIFLISAGCSRQAPAKTYPLEGQVIAVDPAAHTLTIAHQDVPGLMKGMTMPFVVGEDSTWVFKAIAPGDEVHATLVLSDHPELRDVNFTKHSEFAGQGESSMHIPQVGEQVPDIKLVNQSGHAIQLRQFEGKPLLLTFIYTRCPFPDYCPRMSSNFAQVLQDLQKNPQAFPQTQLLSISFDNKDDTPAVLRKYGEAYVGHVDPKFQHWQFASGSTEQIRKAAEFFGLTYNKQNGQIIHSLSTVLIDKDGKVLKVYFGNSWKPEDVAAEFAAASAG